MTIILKVNISLLFQQIISYKKFPKWGSKMPLFYFKPFRKILIISLLLLSSKIAFGLTESFSVINFQPEISKGRYFGISGSQTLSKKSWTTGFYIDYSKAPISLALTRGSQDLLKHLFVFDAYGSAGIADWWQVGINVPVIIFDNYIDPITRVGEFRHALGDIRVETKLRVLNPDRYYVGISFLPFVNIPNWWGNTYVSNGSFSGGSKFVVDFYPFEFLTIALNMGYLFREHFTDALGADIDDQFLYGAGVAAGPYRNVSLIAEVGGLTEAESFGRLFLGEKPDKQRSPLEIRAGLGIDLPKNLTLKAGVGRGLMGGFGDPFVRGFLGLAYKHKAKPRVEKPAREVLPGEYRVGIDLTKVAKIISSYKIYFRLGSYQINPKYNEQLDEVANILLQHPGMYIQIDGYSCSIGSDEKNVVLTTLRTIAVEDYLIYRGVAQGQLTHEGHGSANPVADNNTSEGRELNRRVEFKVLNGVSN